MNQHTHILLPVLYSIGYQYLQEKRVGILSLLAYFSISLFWNSNPLANSVLIWYYLKTEGECYANSQ